MSRKLLIFLIAAIVLTASVYLYVKYKVLAAPGIAPEVSKKETPLDLKPQLIAKLQQLVKDGSDGLYTLSIDELNPDFAASTVDIHKATLSIDSTKLDALHKAGKLPDDIFKIASAKIHISGLGIEDLLNKKSISVGTIAIDNPMIEVYHEPRAYNTQAKKTRKDLTLYQKISGQFKSFSVEKILLSAGSFIHHNNKTKVITRIERASIKLSNILVDSSTQADPSRYLFAKEANLRAEKYHVLTPDRYYSFAADAIDISGVQHTMVATNVHLEPNGGRATLRKKLTERKIIFDVLIPRLQMSGIDWWSFLNREEWVAKEGTISQATFKMYADKSLPAPVIRQDNFPHQVLMRIPVPLNIQNIIVKNSKVVYEEYNHKVKESAKVTMSSLNGTLQNISNRKTDIIANPWTKIKASALFMNKVPIELSVNLNLARVKTGDFNASILVDTLNNDLINPISEPLSLFRVKSGQVQKGKGYFSGNNSIAKGSISLYYSDLHVTPLKADKTEEGNQKSNHLTSLVANTLFIKNSNPKNGSLREPNFTLHRDAYTGFVKLIWLAIRAGIVKSVGIPLKAIDKNAE